MRTQDAAHDKEANAVLVAAEVAFGDDVGYRAAFRRTLNSRFFPSATAQQLDEVDEITGDRYAGDVVRAYAAMVQRLDVSASATQVRCPTLVFHARGDLFIPFAEGSRLASLIPQARFVPIDDDSNAPLEGNPHWPEIEAALGEFFGWGKRTQPAASAILTRRQIEVLLLVGEGCTDKQIARELSLSPRTVEMHVTRAMRTLESRTRAEAALQAAKRGLLG
jgi:DNA-binding NarL/FixJ family response regulator